MAAVLGKELFTPAKVLAQVEAALMRTKRLGSEPQRLVRLAMAYIHEHYMEPIRDDLARHFCVNERYLARYFRQETGVTQIAYLIRYRLQQAKVLLEAGRLSVTMWAWRPASRTAATSAACSRRKSASRPARTTADCEPSSAIVPIVHPRGSYPTRQTGQGVVK